jgi:hypothetical protein
MPLPGHWQRSAAAVGTSRNVPVATDTLAALTESIRNIDAYTRAGARPGQQGPVERLPQFNENMAD